MNLIKRGVSVDQLREAFSYDPETGIIRRQLGDETWSALGRRAFDTDCGAYKQGVFQGETFLAHQVAWAMHYGEWAPEDRRIDHDDGSGKNNKIRNLQLVTSLQSAKEPGSPPYTQQRAR
ncbi:MAG: HNH endonuclease [Mesorhizobium sp.]|nr:MAG: HNH endonuclease [Mesorhizobium sp.]